MSRLCPGKSVHEVGFDDYLPISRGAGPNAGHVLDKPRGDIAEHDVIQRIMRTGSIPCLPQGRCACVNPMAPTRIRRLRCEREGYVRVAVVTKRAQQIFRSENTRINAIAVLLDGG